MSTPPKKNTFNSIPLAPQLVNCDSAKNALEEHDKNRFGLGDEGGSPTDLGETYRSMAATERYARSRKVFEEAQCESIQAGKAFDRYSELKGKFERYYSERKKNEKRQRILVRVILIIVLVITMAGAIWCFWSDWKNSQPPEESVCVKLVEQALVQVSQGTKFTINSADFRLIRQDRVYNVRSYVYDASITLSPNEDLYEVVPVASPTIPSSFTEDLKLIKSDPDAPKPLMTVDGFIKLVHEKGERIAWRVQNLICNRVGDTNEWTYSIEKLVAPEGRPLSLIKGTYVRIDSQEGRDVVAAMQNYVTAVVTYAQKSRERVETIRRKAAEAEALALNPGNTYFGQCSSGKTKDQVILAVDRYDEGGKLVEATLYLADKPWISKTLKGSMHGSPGQVGRSLELSLQEGGGSVLATLLKGFPEIFTKRYTMRITLVLDGETLKGTGPYSFALSRRTQAFATASVQSSWSPQIKNLATRAQADEASAALELARCLDKGQGVTRDPIEAARYFEKAAILGDSEAVLAIGLYYLRAIPGWGDHKIGLELLGQANRMNNPEAADLLGTIYSKGSYGTLRDMRLAKTYLRKAAELGSINGKFNYGVLLLNENNKQFAREAAQSIKQSADAGHKTAARVYAQLLTAGTGVPVNEQEAARYRQLSQTQ